MTRLTTHRPEMHRRSPVKQPVVAATTVAGTLASSFENGDTIDGITLNTGERILIKDQAAQAENGIYVVAASGAPARAYDMDDAGEILGTLVLVRQGTVNSGRVYRNTNVGAITLETTDLTFAQIGAGVLDHGDLTGLSDDDHSFYVPITTGSARVLDHGNPGASETIDFGAANIHLLDLDATCTLTLSGAVASRGGSPASTEGLLFITGNGFGIVWPGSVDWGTAGEPTLDAGLNIVVLVTVDGGTSWQAFLAGGTTTTSTTAEDSAHVHVIGETFSGDASTTAFEIANEPEDGSVAAYVAGSRTAVTLSGTMLTTVTFGSAPGSGTDNILIDYVAVVS